MNDVAALVQVELVTPRGAVVETEERGIVFEGLSADFLATARELGAIVPVGVPVVLDEVTHSGIAYISFADYREGEDLSATARVVIPASAVEEHELVRNAAGEVASSTVRHYGRRVAA